MHMEFVFDPAHKLINRTTNTQMCICAVKRLRHEILNPTVVWLKKQSPFAYLIQKSLLSEALLTHTDVQQDDKAQIRLWTYNHCIMIVDGVIKPT